MLKRSLTAAVALVAAGLLTASAVASPGTVTNDVNMRRGPGTDYTVITTIPAGAPIEVIDCGGWCQVMYAGRTGFISGNYVATGYARAAAPAGVYYQAAPPPRRYYGYYDDPWYDDGYYFGGSPYWRHGRYHHYPYGYGHSGIGFSFSFGD